MADTFFSTHLSMCSLGPYSPFLLWSARGLGLGSCTSGLFHRGSMFRSGAVSKGSTLETFVKVLRKTSTFFLEGPSSDQQLSPAIVQSAHWPVPGFLPSPFQSKLHLFTLLGSEISATLTPLNWKKSRCLPLAISAHRSEVAETSSGVVGAGTQFLCSV